MLTHTHTYKLFAQTLTITHACVLIWLHFLSGVTAEIMCQILEFEADRRSINITINSFGMCYFSSSSSSLSLACEAVRVF